MSNKNTYINKKSVQILLVSIALVIGFFIGSHYSQSSIPDKLPMQYGCNQLGRWHWDILTREYKMSNDFTTNPENPQAEFNQKASDLNLAIVQLCSIDPHNLDPRLKEIIEEMTNKQWGER